jgi:hypothetical protein
VAEFLSDDRAKVLRRLLYAVLALAGLLVLLGLLFLGGGDASGGTVVLAIAAVDGLLAGASLRAVVTRAPSARRLVIVTGIVVVLLSVLIVGILVGLLTVIAGIGLLVITFAPERESR